MGLLAARSLRAPATTSPGNSQLLHIRWVLAVPANSQWDRTLHEVAAEWSRASAGSVTVRITRLVDSGPQSSATECVDTRRRRAHGVRVAEIDPLVQGT